MWTSVCGENISVPTSVLLRVLCSWLFSSVTWASRAAVTASSDRSEPTAAWCTCDVRDNAPRVTHLTTRAAATHRLWRQRQHTTAHTSDNLGRRHGQLRPQRPHTCHWLFVQWLTTHNVKCLVKMWYSEAHVVINFGTYWVIQWLKGPSHLGKGFYIRRGCVPMNTFHATDYESALRFSEKCLVLVKSSFEILSNYWIRNVILTSIQMSSHWYQISRQLLRQQYNYESSWDKNKHFIQGSHINR